MIAENASVLPVDRARALMKSVWMVGVGGLALAGCVAASRLISWSTLWTADRSTAVGLAILFVCVLLLPGLPLAGRGCWWLLLAVWPRPVFVERGPDALRLHLGPFGVHRLDAHRFRVEVSESSEDVSFVADDDEPILPDVRHPDFGGNVVDAILRFVRITPGELERFLSPLVPEIRTPR